jgi:hypothetical protein
MILLSKIPENLADKCMPFKFDYRVLEFYISGILEQQQLPIELIETLDGKCFLFTCNNGEKNYPRFSYTTIFEISKYLESFGYSYADDVQVFHLTQKDIVFPLDRFYNQNDTSMNFLDFLKHTGIYVE